MGGRADRKGETSEFENTQTITTPNDIKPTATANVLL